MIYSHHLDPFWGLCIELLLFKNNIVNYNYNFKPDPHVKQKRMININTTLFCSMYTAICKVSLISVVWDQSRCNLKYTMFTYDQMIIVQLSDNTITYHDNNLKLWVTFIVLVQVIITNAVVYIIICMNKTYERQSVNMFFWKKLNIYMFN